MHALGHDAEGRHRTAVEGGERGSGARLPHIERLAPDAQEAAGGQCRQGLGQGLAAQARAAQAGGERNAVPIEMEVARAEGQRLGQVRLHPADLGGTDPERDQPGGRADIVAGIDVALQGGVGHAASVVVRAAA